METVNYYLITELLSKYPDILEEFRLKFKYGEDVIIDDLDEFYENYNNYVIQNLNDFNKEVKL
jgi:hypothetical protein